MLAIGILTVYLVDSVKFKMFFEVRPESCTQLMRTSKGTLQKRKLRSGIRVFYQNI